MKDSATQRHWIKGMNSLVHPADLGQGEYPWGENVINRGGVIQTRPGLKLIASLAGERLQGFTLFEPLDAPARLVVAVDGLIYHAGWNDFTFTQIPGLSFSTEAGLIQFQQCLQSVKRHEDGRLEVIDPKSILIIQDGESPAGIWDGSSGRHADDDAPFYETPRGLWMAWTGSRLWVAHGSVLRASDLANPINFAEDLILAQRSYFSLPDTITGLIETANDRGLLAFTRRTGTFFQSHIRDRTTWQTTHDFQKILLPRIGCVAGRTAVNQYGLTYWQSEAGFISLDAALNADRSSKMLAIDGEMMRSRRKLAPNLSQACAVAYENFLLLSLPVGGRYNEQTWVIDQAPLEDQGTASGQEHWAGVWSGVRPVQWAQGYIGSQDRVYFASYDRNEANDTHIHVWEAMRNIREDEGGRIKCQFQTAMASGKNLLSFRSALFEVVEVLGEVSLEVFVCGSRGPWHSVGSYALSAEKGPLSNSFPPLTAESVLQNYKPQSRTLRTEEFSSQERDCTVESSGDVAGLDRGFSLLFEWRGQMGLREVTIFFNEGKELLHGKCEASEEGQEHAINEAGEEVD